MDDWGTFSKASGFPTMKLFQDVQQLAKNASFFYRDDVVPKKTVFQSFPFW